MTGNTDIPTVPLSPTFNTAKEEVKKLTKEPSNEDKLDLYGLYKVAIGEDFSKAKQPPIWDLKGRAKYNAWKKFVDEGITYQEAQDRYVKLVETLKQTHGYDENKVPETVGGSA